MELVKNVRKTPRLQSSLLLPMLYETQYRIFNHVANRNKRPLASVAYHPAYDTHTDSLMNDLVFRYEENGIWEVYHLTFLEYINLSRSETLKLDEQGRWIRSERLKRAQAVQTTQEAAMNQKGHLRA